jgi:2-methylaconitate cis-trans-isomerase PrpF
MILYANNHKMDLRNTGNLTVAGARTSFGLVTHTGVARLNGVLPTVSNNVTTDLLASANTRQIKTGSLITATNLNNFIEDCRTIWQNRCLSSAVEEFRYSYCHSSCHSNHGSHGSRGRR